jgi:hypothetical protein
MSTQAAAPAQPYQRKLKNFLLDARFQLKFAVYFIVPTLVISGVLGFFIFSTTGNLFLADESGRRGPLEVGRDQQRARHLHPEQRADQGHG